jgi:hypothetical protein
MSLAAVEFCKVEKDGEYSDGRGDNYVDDRRESFSRPARMMNDHLLVRPRVPHHLTRHPVTPSPRHPVTP